MSVLRRRATSLSNVYLWLCATESTGFAHASVKRKGFYPLFDVLFNTPQFSGDGAHESSPPAVQLLSNVYLWLCATESTGFAHASVKRKGFYPLFDVLGNSSGDVVCGCPPGGRTGEVKLTAINNGGLITEAIFDFRRVMTTRGSAALEDERNPPALS
ncbi:hypothetical protein B0H13DRAFT_2314812 [Mycena leptocephala]|nr:hypothetical protein B0H13DRAFT_2314812 [Mycena leptocephala]